MTTTTPADFHRQRREHFAAEHRRLDNVDATLAWARMAVFTAWVVLAWNAARSGWPSAPAWGLAALFLVMVAVHRRVSARVSLARRGEAHHAAALRRLDGVFDAPERAGDAYAEESHPYARDLDLFGDGGLFERLNHARTRPGEGRLAHMLCTPADAPIARARQEAVQEWEGMADFRETLALAGNDGVADVDVAVLHRWCMLPEAWPGSDIAWHALALLPGVAGYAALGAWAWLDKPLWWPGVALAVNLLILRALAPRLEPTLGTLHRPGEHLRALAQIIRPLEAHAFRAPHNARARDVLREAGGTTASSAIADLARRVERLEWRHNQVFLPFGILALWDVHGALRVEAWRRAHGRHVRAWVEATAELEAMCSLGAYAFERPDEAWPTLVDGDAHVDAAALAHPLLPAARAVGNDVKLIKPVRLMLVSGSNMSGKSTLLRAVGLNTVLAMCGTRVRARSMEVAPVALGCTMRVEDSLQAGRSRFMAELHRLKQVQELASRGPMLFLLDEILHGTNSHDRLAGGRAFLESLLGHGAAGLCTTHDLALARATEGLGAAAVNVHFRDDVKDGHMAFDHVMRPGVVDRSNALELMRGLGLEV